jgi:hypothetical protein
MIGQTVWVERRTYVGNRDAVTLCEATITGQTPRLWVISLNEWRKLTTPKNGDSIREARDKGRGEGQTRVCMTPEAREEWMARQQQERWINEHRHRIADRVRHCDHGTLQRIAEIVGYEVRE